MTRFSIVTPVYNTPIAAFREMVESVLDQTFEDWELLLIDDKSPRADIAAALAAVETLGDPRIRVIRRVENGGISVASNDGVDAAVGDFIVLLDHDDLLVDEALEYVQRALALDDTIDYLYTDEDKIDADGEEYDAFVKPNWSPVRLRSQMYTGHLSVLRTSLVREVGGFRSDFDGSQDHDLVLRVTEKARRIRHLRRVLYHWRAHRESTASSGDAKPYAWDAGVRAVAAHVERVGLPATVVRGSHFGTYNLEWPKASLPSVSVIIPTRGSRGVVRGEQRVFVIEAVRSVLALGGVDDLEIVVVHDASTPPSVITELRAIAGDTLTLVPYDRPFNFSDKCNVGVLASRGDIVVLLNDDVEAISEGFLAELVAPLWERTVGMTGAFLFFEDGSVQHAGHAYRNRNWGHPYGQWNRGDPGPFAALRVDREVSGLTAACVALRREVFTSVGGLSTALPSNFNDVDFSFKLRREGYRLVWLHRVELWHFESRTRERVVHQWEVDVLRDRWGKPTVDPYIGPPY